MFFSYILWVYASYIKAWTKHALEFFVFLSSSLTYFILISKFWSWVCSNTYIDIDGHDVILIIIRTFSLSDYVMYCKLKLTKLRLYSEDFLLIDYKRRSYLINLFKWTWRSDWYSSNNFKRETKFYHFLIKKCNFMIYSKLRKAPNNYFFRGNLINFLQTLLSYKKVKASKL